MEVAIINRGRGPEIAGTRITVYDIVYHLENNFNEAEIAEMLRLSREQVQAAVQYIEKHKEEVMAVHHEIEERNARGNPPEIRAKLKESRAKFKAWLKERRQNKIQEGTYEGDFAGP